MPPPEPTFSHRAPFDKTADVVSGPNTTPPFQLLGTNIPIRIVFASAIQTTSMSLQAMTGYITTQFADVPLPSVADIAGGQLIDIGDAGSFVYPAGTQSKYRVYSRDVIYVGRAFQYFRYWVVLTI